MEKRLISITMFATVLAVLWLGIVLAQDVEPAGEGDVVDGLGKNQAPATSFEETERSSPPQPEVEAVKPLPDPEETAPEPPPIPESDGGNLKEPEVEVPSPSKEDVAVEPSNVEPPKKRIPEVFLPLEGPYFSAEISTFGGTFRSFYLKNEQYARAEQMPEPPFKLPDSQVDAYREKGAPGALDIVSTWSPAFYPFQFEFHKIEWDKSGKSFHPEEDRLVEGAAEGPAGWRGDHIVFTPCDHKKGDCGPSVLSGPLEAVSLVWPNPQEQPDSPFFIEKRYRISGDYVVSLDLNLYNFGTETLAFKMSTAVFGWQGLEEGGSFFSRPRNTQAGACRVGGELTYEEFSEIVDTWEDDGTAIIADTEAAVEWIAVSGQYFLLAAVLGEAQGDDDVVLEFPRSECLLSAELFQKHDDEPIGVVAARAQQTETVSIPPYQEGACYPGWLAAGDKRKSCAAHYAMLETGPAADLSKAVARRYQKDDAESRASEIDTAERALEDAHSSIRSYQIRLFIGPKDIDQLDSVGMGLSDSLDFGILDFIAVPMLRFLRLIFGLVGSWAIAIIILTVLIKLLAFPLTQKSFVQMRRMQALKPEMDKLREKHGEDKQKLNQEMFALYKRHKVNPLGGCLPMLLQMPIYIALYQMLYASVDLYQAPLVGWIGDLTAPDPYYVMPLLLGATMFIQQKISPTSIDSQQAKMMMYVMPVMFTGFMLFLPSGLVLYIFVNTVLTIAQQFLIHRKMPMPTSAT